MTQYLVTGGGGFIGSNIVATLVEEGNRVRVLDNFSTGKRENLSPFEKDIEIMEGDIRSLLTVERALKGVDYVLHQAALPSVPRSIADPCTTNEVNVTGTLNILNTAKEIGIKRVVLASSSSIYGNTPILPKHEGMLPSPLSPYAVSKLTCEYYASVFYQLYGLEVVVLRYFNVFGKNQNPDSQYSAVIPKFCKAMLMNHSPSIYGDGLQTRDFTHVQNVVHANLLAIKSKNAVGKIMNIAGGRQISLNQLFEIINNAIGTSLKPTYLPARDGEVKDSFADISLAKEAIQYSVIVEFEKGIIKTLEHYQNLITK
jgi:UDP-glucose 4-epimerase